jgi:phosphopantothenoylcysteine synthetase/decarboxylase
LSLAGGAGDEPPDVGERRDATQYQAVAGGWRDMLGPASGQQACGEVGAGRMLEPEEILQVLLAFFTPKLLAGRKVLMTAGPTFEAIDPVRGITNLSSGRMGYALACAAQQAGAQVTLVSGPVGFEAPPGVDRINVRSALDMHAAVMARLPAWISSSASLPWRITGWPMLPNIS